MKHLKLFNEYFDWMDEPQKPLINKLNIGDNIKGVIKQGLNKMKSANTDGKVIGYHVTDKRNIKSILIQGLIPQSPLDFGDSGDVKGVYLFKTKEDMESALGQWFGDRIEEWEEENDKKYKETCLTVDLTGLEPYLVDSVEYEWTCTATITPDRILKIEKLY